MSMSKKDFIGLADCLREYERQEKKVVPESLVRKLAEFFLNSNPRFNTERWLDYVAGKCGPNGGKKS